MSEKHSKRRFYLTILFLVIAAIALVHGLLVYLSKDSGWSEIHATSTQELNLSSDLVFLYDLGSDSESATVENKALTILYSDACEHAYMIFSADAAYVELNNVYSINHNPNQTVTVDHDLYQALETVQKHGDRSIYLGPLYAAYDDIFFSQDDVQAAELDPYRSEEASAFYREIAAYASDPEAVELQLLGGDQVCLHVSDAYLDYAAENGISNFIDFFWMRNAFAVDYIADLLIERGYTHGTISSYDGFVRNLDDRDASFSYGIYYRDGNEIDQAAIMNYNGPMSIVSMRNYSMSENDRSHYYEYGDGTILTSYFDLSDGMCKSARNELVCYAQDLSCSDVLLQMLPMYIADTWDPQPADQLKESGICTVWVEDGRVVSNSDTEEFQHD